MLRHLVDRNLIWLPKKEIGHFPVKKFSYDEDYFQKYKEYANTEMGKKITQARIDFVEKHYYGELLDVGVGCGDFIENRKNSYGYDVNSKAIEWLMEKDLYENLYKKRGFEAITFWDSLEHIKDPEVAIKQSKDWVFVSIPIFKNVDHLLESKHYREDEHYWYFTHKGLVEWFEENEFMLIESNEMEIELGREDIKTFAFRRMR